MFNSSKPGSMLAAFVRWRLWVTVLLLSAAVAQARLPSNPLYRFSFDVSRANSEVNEQITIPEPYAYVIAIQFDYAGENDLLKVRKLVGIGIGSQTGVPGVPVTVSLRLVKLNDIKSQTIFEGIETTTGTSRGGGFSQREVTGYFERDIKIFKLEPGKYHIIAKIIDDHPQFNGAATYLVINSAVY